MFAGTAVFGLPYIIWAANQGLPNRAAVAPPLLFVAFLFTLLSKKILRAYQNRVETTLESHGFENVDELPDAVVTARKRLTKVRQDYSDHCRFFVKRIGDRSLWVFVPAASDRMTGRETQWSFAAIELKRDWPSISIRRRRMGDAKRTQLGIDSFDRVRYLETDASFAEAVDAIQPLVDWFVIEEFSWYQWAGEDEHPGKREQWSFEENFVLRGQPGKIKPEEVPRLLAFMSSFADAADSVRN